MTRHNPATSGATLVERPTTAALSPISRLRPRMPHDELWSWIVTGVITLMAFVIRFVGIGYRNVLMFDETYYAKDAWTLLNLGYEGKWPDGNVNDEVAKGITHQYLQDPSFVVHPPLGKWLIAAGEWMFGMNSFGWRFASLVFGTLMVLLVIRLARRLSRSTLVGAFAGILVCFDGLSFVMSRLALLDIFQATFLVAMVWFMVIDRDWFRERLARYLQRRNLTDLGGTFGPLMLWRPWRLAAGIAGGLAIGIKWNSAMALAVMCVVTLLWDVSARRLAGAGRKAWLAILWDGAIAFIHQVVIAGFVYLATWISWFATGNGYHRHWSESNAGFALFGHAMRSWWHYHEEISGFHNGDFIKSQTHTYEAHPIGWLVMARPIGIDAVNGIQPGTDGCPAGGQECLRVVSAVGTPILWWLAAAAIIAGLAWWIMGRDWRFSVPLIAAGATYIPWFFFAERPLFFFYAITIIPFTAINLALVMGRILGPATRGDRRMWGAIIVGTMLGAVVLNFAYMYPVLTDAVLTRDAWGARMWFNTWI